LSSSRSLFLFVKRQGYHPRSGELAPNIDFASRPWRRPSWINITHRNRLGKSWRERPARHLSNHFSILYDRIAFSRQPLAFELQADPLPEGFILPPSSERFSADEISFVHLHRPAKPCLKRIDFFSQLMAIKRHGRFQPQGVPRSQTTRFEFYA